MPLHVSSIFLPDSNTCNTSMHDKHSTQLLRAVQTYVQQTLNTWNHLFLHLKHITQLLLLLSQLVNDIVQNWTYLHECYFPANKSKKYFRFQGPLWSKMQHLARGEHPRPVRKWRPPVYGVELLSGPIAPAEEMQQGNPMTRSLQSKPLRTSSSSLLLICQLGAPTLSFTRPHSCYGTSHLLVAQPSWSSDFTVPCSPTSSARFPEK